MQGQPTTNRQRTAINTVPLGLNGDGLRAEIRQEVLAEIRREAEAALVEIERAAHEAARITRCEEYAAPRYIQRRLTLARERLLQLLPTDDSTCAVGSAVIALVEEAEELAA